MCTRAYMDRICSWFALFVPSKCRKSIQTLHNYTLDAHILRHAHNYDNLVLEEAKLSLP